MVSFEEASSCGADYFELDVHLSADDIPIVYHDPDLSGRLCTDLKGVKMAGSLPLRSLKLQEIRNYHIAGAPIPTLEEVFQWMTHNEIGLNLEIKIEGKEPKWIPDPSFFGETVLDLARNYNCLTRTLFQSFDPRPLIEIRKRDPEALISHLFEAKKDFVKETLAIGGNLIGPHHSLLSSEVISACQMSRAPRRQVTW